MSSKQKLELTWVGKNDELKIEPRILLEKKELSNTAQDENTENMLIHGDNLLALKALEQQYAGKIKCIYIDPPYNTGSAFEHYNDNLEHSIWLSLMKPRLEILRNLLRDDGVIFIQIDDNEQAYLTVLMDEIFGRANRINTICVNMSNMSGVKVTAAYNGKRFPKIKEYILFYVKNSNNYKLVIPKIKKDKWDNEYNYIIPEITLEDYNQMKKNNFSNVRDKLDKLKLVPLKKFAKDNDYDINEDDWKYENSYRIVATKPNKALLSFCKECRFLTDIIIVTTTQGLTKLINTNFNRETKTARIEIVFARDTEEVFYGDHWNDIVTTGGVGQEGGVEFKNSKKPEKLIKRVIESSTQKGDLVLDSFLGSGTTAAVAHKMGRKWIGVEMGEHAYTHCKVRLDKVIAGEDKGGITQSQNWQGGGGYRFYELAPTLIKEDAFGQAVINPAYNAEMLAAAVAKHEGYFYEPNQNTFWKQSNNHGKSYLYVTTNHVTNSMVETIKSEMQDDEFVLIVCKSFDQSCVGDKKVTVKKIPQSLLKNCEFGKDDYKLNIVCPPDYTECEDE